MTVFQQDKTRFERYFYVKNARCGTRPRITIPFEDKTPRVRDESFFEESSDLSLKNDVVGVLF